MVGEIRVGCVPRDLQLVTQRGVPAVGVESVHAFLRASLFWWLITMLWTLTAGRQLDLLLGDNVTGYRLATRFVEDPAIHGVMFRSRAQTYANWKRFPSRFASDYRGDTFVATTLDIRNFYYSVSAPPSVLVSSFTASLEAEAKLTPKARALTELLDALHLAYAGACNATEPRRPAKTAAAPLPVGPPSSQVLANLVMSLAAGDLQVNPEILAVATYADDLVLVSSAFPEMHESAPEYLSRIGVIDDTKSLAAPSVVPVAALDVGLDKSSTVFVRAAEQSRDEPEENTEDTEALDPYIEGEASPDWEAGLLTVLRAPYKRDRVPHSLVAEIRRIVDEIRVGVDKNETAGKLRAIVDEIDSALFLAVRPYWSDLLVAAVATLGPDAIQAMTKQFEHVVESIEPPIDASELTVAALYSGLRASWIHALAQAMSVAMARPEREAFAEAVPQLIPQGRLGAISSATLVRYSHRLRARRLVAPSFVASPLAEFTDWDGPLIGEGIVAAFSEWCRQQGPGRMRALLIRHVRSAVRFVPLHEACLAVHAWADPETDRWVDRVFEVLSAQPLVDSRTLGDLERRAREALQPGAATVPESDEERRRLVLRFALPSLTIAGDQLRVLLDGDRERYGEIAQHSRRATMRVVLAAINRKADVLVLPEWSVLPELLPWVMQRSATAQMLTVVGQAASIGAGKYANVLWTGIPIRDELGRAACLVPPQRQKSYLSPEERQTLARAGVTASIADSEVPVYGWRGLRFASLICFEFADISIREALRDRADMVTVSSWNRDWRYFDAIQEATTRDNYCLTVCVNTGQYPGTRMMRPTSSAKAVVASVQGSDDATVLTRRVDMAPIVAGRARGKRPGEFLEYEPADDATIDDYKPLPPAWS
jgi:predicted amidohydrolase